MILHIQCGTQHQKYTKRHWLFQAPTLQDTAFRSKSQEAKGVEIMNKAEAVDIYVCRSRHETRIQACGQPKIPK